MARWLVAVPTAAFVTFFLFFGMQALIALREGEMEEAPSGKVVGFVRVKRDVAPAPEEQVMPERPPPIDAPPASDVTPDTPSGELSAGTIDVAAPTMTAPVKMAMGAGVGTAVGDTDAVPLMRVEPRYPPQLLQDGIEGWVRLRFTIGRSGQTKDVIVIDSKPAVVFDEAAIAAVRKWKYQPKVVDGQQIERPGLTVRLTFKVPK